MKDRVEYYVDQIREAERKSVKELGSVYEGGRETHRERDMNKINL
jgi:hypothetical protein